MAKAGVSVTKNMRDAQTEEAYFKLLIAQRRWTCGEWKLTNSDNGPLFAGTSIELVRAPSQQPELVEAKKATTAAAAEVRKLTAWLNRMMGWPDDTELELVPPDRLIESISLEQVADKSAASNPDLIEAQQTIAKARAASMISKLGAHGGRHKRLRVPECYPVHG
jgi:hypothetical protein